MIETRRLGRDGPEVTVVGLCVPSDLRPLALRRGCRLFWSERSVEGAVALPADAPEGFGVVRYSLLDQLEANAGIARLKREGRGVVATHVLEAGALADPGGARAAALRPLVRPDRTLAQAAVQFVLANEDVTCAVVRVSTEAHLEEVLGAPSAPPLSGRDLELIFETWANRHD